MRPTSETIIWNTYAKWVQSYRDLPLLYNQWANVVRWELRPRLFLRTSEFLWQEGHTAHETKPEAWAEAKQMLEVYRQVAEDVMAMPVRLGRKTPAERFPGAEETLTIEALMRDRKALQAGTSHYLGQNFAKAYGVTFLGRDGEEHFAEATSWGASTRLVGGLIMAHGDEKGLRLPPKVAPWQVVIVPIYRSDDEATRVLAEAARLADAWRDAGLRVKVDDRDDLRPGFKFADHELRGVPVRVEIGPRDLDAGQVTLVRRDTGAKSPIAVAEAGPTLIALMDEIQQGLFDDAARFRDEHTIHCVVARRAPREDRGSGRVRDRRLVRRRGMRSHGQGRDEGDDPLPAARRTGARRRPVHRVRPPVGGHRDLGRRLLSLGEPARRRQSRGRQDEPPEPAERRGVDQDRRPAPARPRADRLEPHARLQQVLLTFELGPEPAFEPERHAARPAASRSGTP